MTPAMRQAIWRRGALGAGLVLFAAALYFTDFTFLVSNGTGAALAVGLSIAAAGAWHLARTWAWARSFADDRRPPFARLARVRLAAEAFSYLTLRGIAGEPLKVLMLRGDADARDATAAVALERLAFMIGTLVIVGAGAIVAIVTQPLSDVWVRVFTAFAAGAAALTLLVIAVLMGKGTYFAAMLGLVDRLCRTRWREGRAARFAADVEVQLLDAVRGQPPRLLALMGATLASYFFMCAEVYLVLWAVGLPISFGAAMAIETFSRVVSMATVFIPANLGALEASSLAAAAAVGASGGGAPLAFARRIRGLFWAGAGLAVYPRQGANRAPNGPTLLYVPDDPAVTISPFDRIAGLPIAERAMRAAFRAGYARVIVVAEEDMAAAFNRLGKAMPGSVQVVGEHAWRDAVAALPAEQPVAVLGAGSVVSPSLLASVITTTGIDVPAGEAWPVSGLLRMTPGEAADLTLVRERLHARLVDAGPLPSGEDVSRGRAMLALRARDAGELVDAERTIRASVIKPTDNKVARWNRRISLPISVALIRWPITANQLSLVLVLAGFYAGWLYSLGTYGSMVLASVLGLAASVLDGSDGEIARLKYQESALGCWIETIGDYSYYIAIFVGMAVGVTRWTGLPIFHWIGVIALAGTLVTFALLIYLRSTITAGRPDQLHAVGKARFNADTSWWSRLIWRISMVATRSAMPYGILGMAVLGLMPVVVVLAAIGANVYWISLVLKMRALIGDSETGAAAA